jgi:hypothetical protein
MQVWVALQQVWRPPVPQIWELGQHAPPMQVWVALQQVWLPPVPQIWELGQHVPLMHWAAGQQASSLLVPQQI